MLKRKPIMWNILFWGNNKVNSRYIESVFYFINIIGGQLKWGKTNLEKN
jgi:hypothetical protein